MRRSRTWLLLVLLIPVACGEPETDPDRKQTRAIMREIFGAIQVLLPASVDPEYFQSEAAKPALNAAFGALSRQTEALEEHAGPHELRFSYLARNVAGDASAARRAYEEGRFERSSFLLGQITENCIVCHSRMPSPGDSPLADHFMRPEALASLPLERRAALQIATRRFDEALSTLEEILASQDSAALMLGPLTDYLVISIRVTGEIDRARQTLERFLTRTDLWEQYRVDVEDWVVALGQIEPSLHEKPTLEAGRALFEAGLRLDAVPGSRGGRVHLIAASTVLERFCVSHPDARVERAEAYFLLGVIEARVGRNYWVSEAPFFLETAIRMAPDREFAREAFALLERELMLEYEGADEEELPQIDRDKLSALEALIAEKNSD